jgi:hypothetical protein
MWSDTEPNWVLPSRRPPAVLRMLLRSSGRQSGRLSHLALVCTRYRRLHKVLAEREMRKAQEIAGIYRAFRKGHEDNKNEPGAADFYYGEMEMRRAALPRGVERAVLKLYWLMSGYGLRASRSIVATLATLMGASLLFLWIGFAEDHPNSASTSSATRASTSLLGALIYSARIGIGLLRDPQPRLTLWGDFTQIVVRIAVPLFLGLAVLAIRGRVKR